MGERATRAADAKQAGARARGVRCRAAARGEGNLGRWLGTSGPDECVRVESAQERGCAGAGLAGPRAGEGRRIGPGKKVWAGFGFLGFWVGLGFLFSPSLFYF